MTAQITAAELSPWMVVGKKGGVEFYDDNPALLTLITNQALDNTGIHAAAIRDYRKALMLTDPGKYMDERLKEVKKYETQLENDFKNSYTTILQTTGDANIARQAAEQRVAANSKYYMTIVDASYPDLADSYRVLSRKNAGDNPLLE